MRDVRTTSKVYRLRTAPKPTYGAQDEIRALSLGVMVINEQSTINQHGSDESRFVRKPLMFV